MNKTIAKWTAVCAAGAGFLVFALVCYLRGTYDFLLASAFVGCFLFTASLKKIRLLVKAGKALEAGKGTITVDYRDKNLNDITSSVIPVGADRMYFYGYSGEKNDIKVFRWERIRRAVENGRELGKDDILRSVADLGR
jgi:hypothetical protein